MTENHINYDLSSSCYRVAGLDMNLNVDRTLKAWSNLEWHYEPFFTDSCREPSMEINILGKKFDSDFGDPIFQAPPKETGDIGINVYSQGDTLLFTLHQPFCHAPNAWLQADIKNNKCNLWIYEGETSDWVNQNSITSGVMLAFMILSLPKGRLIAHASSVLYHSKAFLFIAKSGTGKSTHSQLWLRCFKDAILLNDDHPIVAIDGVKAIAYGSPWSGKNHVYKNLEAPIGAIVRIKRGPENRIAGLTPVQAYASLSTSFSSCSWDKNLNDLRHKSICGIIEQVPCYTLECLPNEEAAILCQSKVDGI